MANKAYKFRIYPDDAQKVLFARTFGCVIASASCSAVPQVNGEEKLNLSMVSDEIPAGAKLY